MVTSKKSKKINHIVKRPGLRIGDPTYEIPVAEDLVTTPGSRENPTDVDFYSRKYPLESQNVEYSSASVILAGLNLMLLFGAFRAGG